MVYKACSLVTCHLLACMYKSHGAYNLRSSRAVLLDAPSIRTKVTLGDRAFQVAAPKLWNSLPSELRLINNIDTLKRHLKTYLFKVAFH